MIIAGFEDGKWNGAEAWTLSVSHLQKWEKAGKLIPP